MKISLQAALVSLFATFSILAGCGGSGGSNDTPSTDTTDQPEVFDQNQTEMSCFSEEVFDQEEGVCLLDCIDLSDEQCDVLAEQVYGEFDEFVDEEFEPGETPAPGQSMDSSGPIARYTVGADLMLTELSNTQPENAAKFNEMWQAAVGILPRSVMVNNVSEYHVDSDGVGGTLAYVTQLENNIEKWIISFDSADYTNSRDREYVHTTIHEFGHLVFLQKGQVDLMAMGGCDAFAIDEGCSAVDSYLNGFYSLFWTDIIEENKVAQQASEANDDNSLQNAFFDNYADRFVSEYAATNPVEDAAEVFTYFVLRDRPTDNTSIANQKILSFYDNATLMGLRDTIRSKLSDRTTAGR